MQKSARCTNSPGAQSGGQIVNALFFCRDLSVLVDLRRREARPGTDDHEVQSERHIQRLDDLAAPVTNGSRRLVDKEGHIASKMRCQPLKLGDSKPQVPK